MGRMRGVGGMARMRRMARVGRMRRVAWDAPDARGGCRRARSRARRRGSCRRSPPSRSGLPCRPSRRPFPPPCGRRPRGRPRPPPWLSAPVPPPRGRRFGTSQRHGRLTRLPRAIRHRCDRGPPTRSTIRRRSLQPRTHRRVIAQNATAASTGTRRRLDPCQRADACLTDAGSTSPRSPGRGATAAAGTGTPAADRAVPSNSVTAAKPGGASAGSITPASIRSAVSSSSRTALMERKNAPRPMGVTPRLPGRSRVPAPSQAAAGRGAG